MTEQEAKQKLVEWVTAQIGYHEGSGNYNKYAPMAQEAIGWNAQNQPWCSVFVAAAFSEVFGVDVGSRMLCSSRGSVSAAVSANQAAYASCGQFYYGNPEVGDQVFYNNFNHTGIVIDVSGMNIVAVDGNYSDGVTKRNLLTTSKEICGYGRPRWNLATDVEKASGEDTANATNHKEFKKGDLVSVNGGAHWYTGANCNPIVYKHNWYVLSSYGDRVVINDSEDGIYHIMSPISTRFLTLVKSAKEENILDEVEAVVADELDPVIPTIEENPKIVITADQKPSFFFGIGQMLVDKIRKGLIQE